MASLTIRNLDEAVKQGLRRRAAERGVSMEEEARAVLRAAAVASPSPRDLGEAIRARFVPLGGVELGERIPPREPGRIIAFGEWLEDGGTEPAESERDAPTGGTSA